MKEKEEKFTHCKLVELKAVSKSVVFFLSWIPVQQAFLKTAGYSVLLSYIQEEKMIGDLTDKKNDVRNAGFSMQEGDFESEFEDCD
jgi:hypothetical protein